MRLCSKHYLQPSLTITRLDRLHETTHNSAEDTLPSRPGTWRNPAEMSHVHGGGYQLLGVTHRTARRVTPCLAALKQEGLFPHSSDLTRCNTPQGTQDCEGGLMPPPAHAQFIRDKTGSSCCLTPDPSSKRKSTGLKSWLNFKQG